MLKDRQEVLAVGELAVFVSAWLLAAVVALDTYRHRENLVPADRIAASETTTEVRSILE